MSGSEIIAEVNRRAPLIRCWGESGELLDEGDTDGAAIWRGILKAIEELQRGRRDDEAVNCLTGVIPVKSCPEIGRMG
jgi:hypothetical protein